MHIVEELEERGLFQDSTDKVLLAEQLSKGSTVVYAGYDPTAASLHVGNLVPTLMLARLQKAGHKPIALVGGATGMIGDPSGKSAERNLLDDSTLQSNLNSAKTQLERLLDFDCGPHSAEMANNYDWFKEFGFVHFLRDVGKYLNVNTMMGKESVKTRLNDPAKGISFTEFSYMLLQAYDFVHLAKTKNCRLQVGGSDQWGNITAGTELARKMGIGEKLHGMVAPLLLDSTGAKMGKTSDGERVWLNASMTSPYAFYQYWINQSDDDVERLLKMFSWRTLEEIKELSATHAEAPHKREGQKVLAGDVTAWIHGQDALERALKATKVMFGGELTDLSDDDLRPLLLDLPSHQLKRADLTVGVPLVDMLIDADLAKSKGAARRSIKAGGIYINNKRISEEDKVLNVSDLGTDSMILLRSGKKKYHLVQVL